MSNYFATSGGCAGFWLVVDTVPELTATINDAVLPNGASCDVAELLDGFALDKASTEPIDGITRAATMSGVGRWVRQCSYAAQWRSRWEWHIDQAAGDDHALGTAATPLASFEELFRRIGTGPQLVNEFGPGQGYAVVYLHGDYSGDVNFFMDDRYQVGKGGGGLLIRGVKTLLHAAVLTAGTVAYNPATSTVGMGEDTALPVSWAASGLDKHQIVLGAGSSAPGAYGWIAKQIGASPKIARLGPVYDELNYARVDPVSGDAYDVYELPTIFGNVHVAGAATLLLYDLDLDPGHVWDWSFQSSGASSLFLFGCSVSSGHPHMESASLTQLYGCFFGHGVVAMHCTRKGEATYNCCTFDCPLSTSDPACATLEDCLLQPATNPTAVGRIHVASGTWACVQDAPGASVVFSIPPGAMCSWAGLVWGAGNGHDYGVMLHFAAIIYTNGQPPTFGAAGVNDWYISSVGGGAWAALPTANVLGSFYV